MMEERYHATTQNWFYTDMSNVNKNIAVEAKLISPPDYIVFMTVWLSYFALDLGGAKTFTNKPNFFFEICKIRGTK